MDSNRGRGRGNYRGGRGDSARGSDRGGRGGGRGGNRGSHQGGGFEPGRGGSPSRGNRGGRKVAHVPFWNQSANPIPDPKITALENKIMEQQAGIVGQMSKLTVSKKGKTVASATADSNAFPVRPAYGTFGTAMAVWANYFPVKITENVLYRYTVTPEEIIEKDGTTKIEPTKGVKTRLAISQVLRQLNGKAIVATEFKGHLISTKPLGIPSVGIKVCLPDAAEGREGNECCVKFSEPTEVSIANLMSYIMSMEVASGDLEFPRHAEAVDALNVILGHGPCAATDISSLGHSRFFPFGANNATKMFTQWPARPLLAARGLFQSTRIGTGRLLVNTNVTHGVFKVSGSLKDIFERYGVKCVKATDVKAAAEVRTIAKILARTKIQFKSKLSDGKTVQMSKTMQGLVCVSEIRQRLTADPPPRFLENMEYPGPRHVQFWLTNENGGGRYITVADFYKQKYNANLEDLPLINTGSLQRPTFIPADFITVKLGQPIKAKLNAKETADMVLFACRTPTENAASIMEAQTRETLHRDTSLLQKFGVSVDKSFLAVQARQLGAPRLEYSSANRDTSVDVTPFNGSWNLKDIRVATPGKQLTHWTWMNIVQNDVNTDKYAVASDVEKFGDFLAKNMKMSVGPATSTGDKGAMSKEAALGTRLDGYFKYIKEQKKMEFCLIILYNKDIALYNKVKVLADCKYGIHTCCVTRQKFMDADLNYFANVSLKVNLKMGGVNHRLKHREGILKEAKTMIVGYDVTHPTNLPEDLANAAPSVVGLVASIDQDFAQWPAASWEQESKKEMLDEQLTSMFASRLALWYKRNNKTLPENIIIFRDGVSEGQYAQVLDQELPHFRAACKQIYPSGIKPKITIVVSVKRHQTRFYPIATDKMSRSGNTPPGTVVDRGITQARYWDFYLTAHDALQGTARPAHYTVVYDEIFRAKYKSEAANELQRLTHNLCYLFGRATKAVSICPPAYYADIVCTRARAHRPEFDDAASVVAGANPAPATTRKIHEHLQDSMYYI